MDGCLQHPRAHGPLRREPAPAGERPFASLHLAPSDRLTGAERFARLRDNLVEALAAERILLVLDNFETQLETLRGGEGYTCADPEWDLLLEDLARRLPATGSRLFLTCRHRLAALAPEGRAVLVPLAALPPAEAVLYLQGQPDLAALALGSDEGRNLALELLEVSRGHPLILSRLAPLARNPAALAQALARLRKEGLSGLASLPELAARKLTPAEREKERAYLEDAAERSVDLLIERASPPARQLLWVMTRASEPVTLDLIEGAWSGRSLEEEQIEQLRQLLALMGDSPPPELVQILESLPAELREQIEREAGPGEEPPPAEPLLAELVEAGLLTREGDDPPLFSFHELVRERVEAWRAARPEERGERGEEAVWIAYGERYAAAFEHHHTSGRPGARDLATEAGRRALSYLVRARAFDRLGSFAGTLVTGTYDPGLLGGVIIELEAVTDQVPAGEPRWRLRTYLADALRREGHPDRALAVYEQAEAEAVEAGHWAHVGVIRQNWAHALGSLGRLDRARETYLRSAEATEQAGSPRVLIVGSELEALRIEVMQGQTQHALPEIEKRVQEVRVWWSRHRAGDSVPEAPDAIELGRTLVGGLDIAAKAQLAAEGWQACLDVLGEIEEVQGALGEGEHERARTRFSRYGALVRLGRFDEARQVIEPCLEVFRRADDVPAQAMAFSALADLWNELEDPGQAASLARRALALCNRLPAPDARLSSHHNLSSYLDQTGDFAGSARHDLAALAYIVATGAGEHLKTWRRNFAISSRQSAQAGGRYDLPRLADLLSLPEFEPLRRFLAEREVPVPDLQAVIDEVIAEVAAQVRGSAP